MRRVYAPGRPADNRVGVGQADLQVSDDLPQMLLQTADVPNLRRERGGVVEEQREGGLAQSGCDLRTRKASRQHSAANLRTVTEGLACSSAIL